MSKNEFPPSRGRARQHMGGKAHSFDLSYGAGSTVDGELNRLFRECWEGTERSKILQARRNSKKLLADADRRVTLDYPEFGDDLSAKDSANRK